MRLSQLALRGGLLAVATWWAGCGLAVADDWQALAKWQGASGPYVVISDEHLFASLDLARPGLEPVRAAVSQRRYAEAYAAWGRYWAARRRPTWVFDPAVYPQAMRTTLPWTVRVIIEQAQAVVARDFQHATYTPVAKGRYFDWAHDTSDSAYIGFHYFFWLPCLPRAYLLTGDEKYARAFVEIVCSWHDALPDIRNFNAVVWNSQLGSSLRATYMLEAYHCFRDCPALSGELHEKVLKILLGHARYVYDVHMRQYTEWNGQNSGAAWLACLSALMPEFRQADDWKQAAVRIMRAHIERNFHADGGHKELCIQYHVTGLRDLSLGVRALRAAGDDSILQDKTLRAKFREAFAWPLRVAFPCGFTPALNSGVVDKEWLLYMGIGAELFDDPEFRWALRRFAGPHYIPVAKNIATTFPQMDELFAAALRRGGVERPPAYTSLLLPQSGFAVLRDGWDPDSLGMVLDFGTPWGGHGYPGKLSFTLWGRDALLASLPGSPASYSLPVYGKWCNQTKSHNTVLVGGKSQRGPYSAQLDAWHDVGDAAFVAASTDVYKPVSHRRRVTFVKGEYFVVFDHLAGGAEGTPLAWMYHCPQGLQVGEDARVQSPAGRPGVLLLPPVGEAFDGVETGIGHGAVPVQWHPGYKPGDAWRDDIDYIGYQKRLGCGGSAYAVAVVPFRHQPPQLRATSPHLRSGGAVLPASRARSLLLSGPSGDDLHVSRVGDKTVLECAGFETDAAQAWIRRDKQGGALRRLALADATRLAVNGTTLLAADGLRAVSLSFQPDGIRGCLLCAGSFRLGVSAPGFTHARLADEAVTVKHDGSLAVIVGSADGILPFSLAP
jgi:hypothetical protein